LDFELQADEGDYFVLLWQTDDEDADVGVEEGGKDEAKGNKTVGVGEIEQVKVKCREVLCCCDDDNDGDGGGYDDGGDAHGDEGIDEIGTDGGNEANSKSSKTNYNHATLPLSTLPISIISNLG
jgi:hypothetical protein